MTTAAELRHRLDAAQERLTRVLGGVTEEQFKRRPPATKDEPSPWRIAEVLAHILTTERLWADRISLALAGDAASITPSPPGAHEEGARSGRHVPVPLLIHGLLGARHETMKLLAQATTPDSRLIESSLWHPRLAEGLDLAWMFDKIATHEDEHAAQIEGLREAVGARPVESKTRSGESFQGRTA